MLKGPDEEGLSRTADELGQLQSTGHVSGPIERVDTGKQARLQLLWARDGGELLSVDLDPPRVAALERELEEAVYRLDTAPFKQMKHKRPSLLIRGPERVERAFKWL